MTTENTPSPDAAPAPAGTDTQPAAQPAPGGTTMADAVAARDRSDATHVARAESMSASEVQAEAKRLRDDPKSALWHEGPDHDRAVAISFRAHELDAEAAGEPTEDLPLTMRLANRAIDLGSLPIPQAAMDPRVLESDADLVNFVKWADSENVSTPLLNRMFTSYANALAAGGGLLTEQGIAEMEREFSGQIHPQQAALLKRWLREELGPTLARGRRGR